MRMNSGETENFGILYLEKPESKSINRDEERAGEVQRCVEGLL